MHQCKIINENSNVFFAERVQNKVQCCNEEHVPGEDSPPMEEKSEESEADVINRGDCKKETIKKEKLATTEGTASGQCFCPSVTAHNSDISQQSVILYTPLWNIINQHCLS